MAFKTARQAKKPAPKSSKKFKEWKLHVAIVAGVFLLVSIIGYVGVLPRIAASHYDRSMGVPRERVDASFRALADSTDKVTTVAEGGQNYREPAQSILKEIQTGRQRLDDLETANNKFARLPFVFANDAYTDAQIHHRRYGYLIAQSRAVLADYERLVDYLSSRAESTATLRKNLNEFNAVTDLNLLAGQGAKYQQIAEQIDQEAAELTNLGHPPGSPAGTADNTAMFEEAAEGFRTLARGLNGRSDPLITQAAQRLEAVTAELDSESSTELITAVHDTATLREVHTLTERLDTVGN